MLYNNIYAIWTVYSLVHIRVTYSFTQQPITSKFKSKDHNIIIEDKVILQSYSSSIPYEILPINQVFEYLVPTTSIDNKDEHIRKGLTYEQASALLKEVGPNELKAPTKQSMYELFISQFDDTLVKILVVIAFLSAAFSISDVWDMINDSTIQHDNNSNLKSIILQSIAEPTIIIAILLLNALVGVWQDLSARSSLEALEKMQPRLTNVLRQSENDGNSKWVTGFDATQLVPGDIIRLRAGDSVPADVRLISLTSSTLYVDESSLTGESASVLKLPGDEGLNTVSGTVNNESIPIQDQSSMLFSGCFIRSGLCLGIVVRTGISTQIGKIQSSMVKAQVEEGQRKTPLGEQLDEFGKTLSFVIGGICGAVWLVSIPHFNDPIFDSWIEGSVYYAKIAVALGVAAIPEGLPGKSALVCFVV